MRKKAICILLCFIFLILAFTATAFAQSPADQRNVKVGFFQLDGYHMIDGQGDYSGYGYDLLQRLYVYVNWTYEYIGYERSWEDMLTMLENGEIDLLTGVHMTDQRLEQFDFSSEPVGYSSTIVTAKTGNSAYASGNYGEWDGVRVGMIPGSNRNDSFEMFADEYGFHYTPVYFDTFSQLLDALQTGDQIDVAVTSDQRSVTNETILAEFDTKPYYIAVKKGNAALLKEVDRAISSLSTNEPEFRTELSKKYFSADNLDNMAFTAEERAFIAENQDTVFTAALSPDRAPLSWFENGVPTGFLSDITSRIIDKTGLNIEILETQDHTEYNNLVDDTASVDVVLDAWYHYSDAEKNGYKLTQPYLTATVARLYLKENSRNIRTLALIKGSNIAKQYGEKLALSYDITYYDTSAEVIDAVYSGKQDAAYLYYHMAEKALYDDLTNRMAMDKIYGYEIGFAVGVSHAQNVLLLSILNKAVNSIDNSVIEEAVGNYTTYPLQPFSFVGYLYANPVVTIVAVIILFIVLLCIVFFIFNMKNRKRDHAQMVEEQKKNMVLADALAVAEKADMAKSQFLSGVSHEMRTPLNAMIGFMELAKDTPDDIDQMNICLGYSETAAKQLLVIINDVLDMSAIEAGQMKIGNAPFDLKQLLTAITNIYFAQCHQKGVSYETKLLTQIEEWVEGDQLRLSQILNNLLSNAVKFTKSGHVWLSVRQTKATDRRVFIQFEVSDTGCGMSEEMLTRWGKPFEQESVQTAEKYGGNGLGLSIVRNLTALMDGAVDVKSVQGQGTSFLVDLPFHRCGAQEAKTLTAAGDLRVLVVDDTVADCDYVSGTLKRLGVRHTCVGSGEKAIAELKKAVDDQQPYTVCLVDWSMPNMDGLEFTRQIRAQYHWHMAIIVVSAYEHGQAELQAKAAGADHFVSKPLFQSTLFDLMMTLSGGKLVRQDTAKECYTGVSGRKILLAEDNDLNRLVAVGLLKKCGIVCDEAQNGKQAVELFIASAPGTYDAILMDVRMPEIDGMHATKLIRASAHPEAADIPIIALTANAFNEDIAKTLQSGMNAHVAKPIDLQVLLETLEKLLRERGKQR